jgi:hypothetical protein
MRNRAGTPMMFSTAAMKIGDLVLYEGRLYYLRGLDPMSVPDRRVILEDPETGDELAVPAGDVSDVEPCPPPAV